MPFLQTMRENNSETITTAPKVQKLERLNTIRKEHKDALERAVSLKIPHAVTDSEEEPLNRKENSSEGAGKDAKSSKSERKPKSPPRSGRTNWDTVLELFKRNESGELLLEKDTSTHR